MTEVTPAQQEASGDDITIEWEGMTLTVPADASKWDIDAVEAFEQGKAVTLLRLVFTSDVYDRMKATFQRNHGRKMLLEDVNGLMDEMAKAAGFGSPGE